MNKLMGIILILTMTIPVVAGGVNLVPNGNLELGDWDPEGWLLPDKKVYIHENEWMDSGAPQGKRYLKIGNYVHGLAPWKYLLFGPGEIISIDPRQVYYVSFMYKMDKEMPTNLSRLQFRYFASGKFKQITFEHLDNPSEWTKYEMLTKDHGFLARHGIDGVRIQFGMTSTRGNMHVDDLVMRLATPEDIARVEKSEELDDTMAPPIRVARQPKKGKATGEYHIEKLDNVWTLVRPNGEAFFTVGLGASGAPRYNNHPELYEWFMDKYHSQKDWKTYAEQASEKRESEKPEDQKFVKEFRDARMQAHMKFIKPMHQQLIDWNFNSIGGWNVYMIDQSRKWKKEGLRTIPGTICCSGGPNEQAWNLQNPDGKPMWMNPDPWNEDWQKNQIEWAKGHMGAGLGSDTCMGYYVENEMYLGQLWEMHHSPAASKAFVAFLSQRYNADAKALTKAWKVKGQKRKYKKIEDVLSAKPYPVSWNDPMVEDMMAWEREVIQQYIRTKVDAMRKHDPDKMLFSNRFHPAYFDTALRVMDQMSVFDAVGFNLYPAYGQNGMTAGELKIFNDMHDLSTRPVIVPEWAVCSRDVRSVGIDHFNRNLVDTQEERGKTYRNTVRQWVASPYMIGCQWFSCWDAKGLSPMGMELDTRNANWGMMRADGTPYETFIKYVSETNKKAGMADRDDSWSRHSASRYPTH